MPSHRSDGRRGGARPDPVRTASDVDRAAAGISVEEGFVPDVDTFPSPAGFGTEVSTSSTTNETVATYTVPDQTVAYLREASLALESNGQAQVSIAGTTYGPYTGAGDVSIPLDPGALTPGSNVRVVHQSTDGSSTTTKAQLVVVEV